MKRTRLVIAGGAAAVGLTLGVAAIASAGTSQTDPAAETDDVQEPQLDGSVQAPEAPEGTSEADEAKGLESLATVTADEAISAATAEVPGTADTADLGNENGTVVYEVDVTADDGTQTEVKVDAGNGAILDTEADDEGDENEADEADDNDADDNDAENEADEVEDD